MVRPCRGSEKHRSTLWEAHGRVPDARHCPTQPLEQVTNGGNILQKQKIVSSQTVCPLVRSVVSLRLLLHIADSRQAASILPPSSLSTENNSTCCLPHKKIAKHNFIITYLLFNTQKDQFYPPLIILYRTLDLQYVFSPVQDQFGKTRMSVFVSVPVFEVDDFNLGQLACFARFRCTGHRFIARSFCLYVQIVYFYISVAYRLVFYGNFNNGRYFLFG